MGAPLLVSKAKFYHLHTSTGLSPSTSHSLGLPPSSLSQQLVLPPPSHQDQQRHTHPSTHLGYGCLSVRPLASVWTFGDHPGRHTEVRIKHDFTSVPESSWLWRKLHQKVQLFQREGGGTLYWPACWVAYKRKSWRAWFQSAASDGHRHTPCGNNLNYTIWTLYAGSVSSHQAPFTQGCPPFTQGRALLEKGLFQKCHNES